jgi:hypothetical protein
VSLHAPNDALRGQLVPVNRRYAVDDVLAAVGRYVDKTHRRVTFEYALMAGINDGMELAGELAEKLDGLLCHVNLIPLNPIPDSAYRPSMMQIRSARVGVLRDRGFRRRCGCGGDRDRGWATATVVINAARDNKRQPHVEAGGHRREETSRSSRCGECTECKAA